MLLSKKIAILNDLVDGTLSIIHYSEWELGSYRGGSLFTTDGFPGHVRAKSFDECVNKAYALVAEEGY